MGTCALPESRLKLLSSYSARAQALALRGLGLTWPNPVVGAVCVKNNKIIGEGYHQCAGEEHAEVLALREAGSDAAGSTLFVSLEPCRHFGKTPPCANAIIDAGVEKVVISCIDKKNGGADVLQENNVEVEVLGHSPLINLPWLFHSRYGKPLVVAKVARAIDGAIGAKKRLMISGGKAARRTALLRSASQAIIVGAGTANSDNPKLHAPGDAQPTRVVVGRNVLGDRTCLKDYPGRYALGFQHARYETLENSLEDLTECGAQMVLIETGSTLFKTVNENVLADVGIVYSSTKRFDQATVFSESFGSGYKLAFSEQLGEDLMLVFVKKGVRLLESVFRNN